MKSRDQLEYLNPFQKWKVMGTESRNLSEKRMGDPIWRSWIMLSTEAKLPENNNVNVTKLKMMRFCVLSSNVKTD